MGVTSLEELDISNNLLESLPDTIEGLINLRELDISDNKNLKTISSNILRLDKLSEVDCEECEALTSPPYAVCEQGWPAIKQFFIDLEKESVVEISVVPIAVLGNKMSGKTSLIRSLQSGTRQLTYREKGSPLDETTRVFEMQTMALKDNEVRFIDFGGNDVYHLSYQLTIKDSCIPCFVVNMKAFAKLVLDRGAKEAAQKLCIDWLSHTYLASPQLGAPILVLTHRDTLSESDFQTQKNELLSATEEIIGRLRKEMKKVPSISSEFSEILHFKDDCKPLFTKTNIVTFSNEIADSSSIHHMLHNIESRCSEFRVEVPGVWDRIRLFVENQSARPYIPLSEIHESFPGNRVSFVLRYMHNSGKVLWYENIDTLSDYLFGNVSKITEMVALLFDHEENDKWERRIREYIPVELNGDIIGYTEYEELIKEFKSTGLLSEAVLLDILDNESEFPTEVALALLKAFLIIYGPVEVKGQQAYIIPSFSTKYLGDYWKEQSGVPLRVEIGFHGLKPPSYAYQLLSVLMLTLNSDFTTSLEVFKNGVVVQAGNLIKHLIHDHNAVKVTIQVTAPVNHLPLAWRNLLRTVQSVLERAKSIWKAAHPSVKLYCAHCLIVREPHPDIQISPKWFAKSKSETADFPAREFNGIEPVACQREAAFKQRRPTVPRPFRFPCELSQ